LCQTLLFTSGSSKQIIFTPFISSSIYTTLTRLDQVTTYEYWIPEGADGTHPGDRQVFVNKFYANNGTQTAETLGECYWINADKQVCQWTLRALEGDDAIILYQRYAHASSNPKGKAAIVGGTGSYARATGECEVDSDLSYNVFNYDCQIRF
jgi:hypothetical protein